MKILKFKEYLNTFINEAFTFFPNDTSELEKEFKKNNNLEDILVIFEIVQDYISQNPISVSPPLAFDLKKPNSIKITRALLTDEFINFIEKNLKVKTNKNTGEFKYNSLSIAFGEGSRGNRGSKNAGNTFEKVLFDDLEKVREYGYGTNDVKFNYPKIIDELNKIIDFQNIGLFTVSLDGGKNQSRPIQITDDSLLITGYEGDFYLGPTVTDITVHSEELNKDWYLSLKHGETAAFFNIGVSKIFNELTVDVDIDNIKDPEAQSVLNFFQIDEQIFIDIFQDFSGFLEKKQQISEDILNKINKSKMTKFLKSGIGQGYVMVHAENAKKLHVYDMTPELLDKYSKIESCHVYYGGTTFKGKRVSIMLETPKYSFRINLRNKKDTNINKPNQITGEYKYK